MMLLITHLPNSYLFLFLLLFITAPGAKFVKSTKVGPPYSRDEQHDREQEELLVMIPPPKISLPMKKPLHGNKNHHGQMNRDLVGTVTPPYGGTIFVDGAIINNSAPTSLKLVEMYSKTQCTNIYDRRNNQFWKSPVTHIFKVTFKDGIITEFWVRGTDFTRYQAKQKVLYYAKYLGRIPQFLRVKIRVATIQAGDYDFGGHQYDGVLTLYAGSDYENSENGDITEETLVHEGAHIAIDVPAYADSAWNNAVNKDQAFISSYAKEYPDREDVAESLVLWLGIALGTLNSNDASITNNQIPNRLSYFDNQGYNLYPLPGGTGGKVQGYTWKKVDDFYYPCGSWVGGGKSIIYGSNPPTPPSPTPPSPTPPSSNCSNNSSFSLLVSGVSRKCGWFSTKSFTRCKKKGALRNCPVSCKVCTKTGEQVCEGRGLTKAACLDVGCCHWDNNRCWSSVGQQQCF